MLIILNCSTTEIKSSDIPPFPKLKHIPEEEPSYKPTQIEKAYRDNFWLLLEWSEKVIVSN